MQQLKILDPTSQRWLSLPVVPLRCRTTVACRYSQLCKVASVSLFSSTSRDRLNQEGIKLTLGPIAGRLTISTGYVGIITLLKLQLDLLILCIGPVLDMEFQRVVTYQSM